VSLFSGIIAEEQEGHNLIHSAILALASGIQLHKRSGKLTTMSELYSMLLFFLLFNIFYPQRTFNKYSTHC